MKALYTVIEKPGDKSFWLRIGAAFPNRDGSWSLRLDALPVNGQLQMRDMPARDEREGARGNDREGARSNDREGARGNDREGRDALGRALA